MLQEFMKQILYLDVQAQIDGTTVTRRFSSSEGIYSLEATADGTYRIRWDVTLLNGITTGKDVKFIVNCYYDTGFGTMDAKVLENDISNVNEIPKTATADTLKAAYALQNMVDKNYVRTGTVTSEKCMDNDIDFYTG